MTKEIVVSYFNENLNWLSEIGDYKITLYNKSNNEIENSIKLENVGREMHSYFYHIVSNYNNLSDWVFFTQGNPFDHVSNYMEILNGFPESILQYSKLNVSDCHFFSNDHLYYTKQECKSDGTPHHWGLDINGLWVSIFNSPPSEKYEFVAGCIFCLTKEQILLKDISFYEKCIEVSKDRKMSPWEFERMMCNVFDPNIK